MASAIDELLAQFPEMDPVLLKCIKFLQIGGKEGRKGIKDMTNEIFTTRSTSPLAAAQAKSDKRKASQAAVGQSEKKPRMELDSGFDTKPGSNISTGSAASSEGCKTCGDPSIKGKQGLKVECSECHQYFHQECHKPPVPTSTASDPRTIWKCSSCSSEQEKGSFVNPKNRKAEEKNKDKSSDSVPFQRVDKLSAKRDMEGKSREGSPASLSGWGNLIKSESKKKNETKLTSVDIFAADPSNETAKPKKSKYKDSLAEDGDDKKMKKKKKKKSQQ